MSNCDKLNGGYTVERRLTDDDALFLSFYCAKLVEYESMIQKSSMFPVISSALQLLLLIYYWFSSFSSWCVVRWCVSSSAWHPHVPRGFAPTHINTLSLCAHLLGHKLIQCKQLRFENDRPDFSMGLLREGGCVWLREGMLHVEWMMPAIKLIYLTV